MRPVEAGDGPAFARVHVRAWQAGYRGIIDDAYLDALDPQARGAKAEEAFGARQHQNQAANLAAGMPLMAIADESPAGVATWGPYRQANGELGDDGLCELWMLNVDPAWWGKGVAAALVDHALAQLAATFDVPVAVLWVLEDNARARRFYEKTGWRPDHETKTITVGSQQLTELRYSRFLG